MKGFVPVVGNTHELQNRKSPIGDWFMATASQANPRDLKTQTSQGFYVVGADGSAYGFNNNRSVERVLAVLDKGMAAFRQTPQQNIDIPQETQWAPQPPPGTRVLRVYSRIAPVPPGSNPSNENVQRDHFWLLESELQALKKSEVPESMQLRLCRFAMVDAIRGEPDFWTLSEVKIKNIGSHRSGGQTTLDIAFLNQTADKKRGLEGSLRLVIEPSGAIKGFGESVAWGASTYTPNPPAGKFRLKFAFIDAPKSPDVVAPQAAMFGREYLTGR